MRRRAWLLVLGGLLVVAALVAARWPRTRPGPGPAAAPDRPSPLYLAFNPGGFTERHAARFERVSESGAVALGYEPTREIVRASHMDVLATDAELAAALGAMRAELVALAEAAGAAITAGPSEAVGDRPVNVLRFHFGQVDLRSLRGFYFTYRLGRWVGAVDVFAAREPVDGKPGWAIVCMVHEPWPAEAEAAAARAGGR
jgi:hypothetical protein